MEQRHTFSHEGLFCKFSDIKSKPPGGALKKISVPGRTLRVELKIPHLAVFKKDHLNVLSAHIYNDIHIIEVVEGRLGVGHCLDECDIRITVLLKHIFCVSRS